MQAEIERRAVAMATQIVQQVQMSPQPTYPTPQPTARPTPQVSAHTLVRRTQDVVEGLSEDEMSDLKAYMEYNQKLGVEDEDGVISI